MTESVLSVVKLFQVDGTARNNRVESGIWKLIPIVGVNAVRDIYYDTLSTIVSNKPRSNNSVNMSNTKKPFL